MSVQRQRGTVLFTKLECKESSMTRFVAWGNWVYRLYMVATQQVFLLLMIAFLPLPAMAETYSDENLQTKTVYELELIPKKHLAKDQRKLVKSIIKSNRTKDCTAKQDEFFEMPLSELQSLNEKDMSKSEKKMFKFIRKNREKLEKIIKVPTFSLSEDDFEETIEFRTSSTANTGFDKNVCPFRGMSWGQAGTNQRERWFARGRVGADGAIAFRQFYLRYSPQHFADNPYMRANSGWDSGWYYGVTRVVGKGYGELDHIMIDHSFNITAKSNTQYIHDIGINVTEDQLTDWYNAGKAIKVRIYSKTGENLDTEIPFSQISVFYEGQVESGLL